MGDAHSLNRLELNILKCLYDNGCTDQSFNDDYRVVK